MGAVPALYAPQQPRTQSQRRAHLGPSDVAETKGRNPRSTGAVDRRLWGREAEEARNRETLGQCQAPNAGNSARFPVFTDLSKAVPEGQGRAWVAATHEAHDQHQKMAQRDLGHGAAVLPQYFMDPQFGSSDSSLWPITDRCLWSVIAPWRPQRFCVRQPSIVCIPPAYRTPPPPPTVLSKQDDPTHRHFWDRHFCGPECGSRECEPVVCGGGGGG